MWAKEKDSHGNTFYRHLKTNRITNDEPKEGPLVYHILIKHRDSRHPINDWTKEKARTFISKILTVLIDQSRSIDTYHSHISVMVGIRIQVS